MSDNNGLTAAMKVEESAYSDKMATLQVLGGLLKNPILIRDRDYPLDVQDFTEQFHRILFGAIDNMVAEGAKEIDVVNITQFLKNYPSQYKVFFDNRGDEYIPRAKAVAADGNFDYYYKLLKKFSLLNELNRKGIETKDIYDPNPNTADPIAIARMQDRFNSMTMRDIMDEVEGRFIKVKSDFMYDDTVVKSRGGEGIFDLLRSLKEKPEMGLSLISPVMTTIYHGRRLGKFYLESAAQGMGKSRRACGEAAHLAVPYLYDTDLKKWVFTGMEEGALVISTELKRDECQTMWLAYVSGVPEDHIIDNKYDIGEESRVWKAAEFIEKANLHFVQCADFDIEDIEGFIKEYNLLHGVKYVFYDYLSTSMKVISGVASRARVSDLKEFQILNLFAQRLKTLCTKLNIHIQSATQLNREWKKDDGVIDSTALRGAYALGDQPDIATILLPVQEKDESIINSVMQNPQAKFVMKHAPNMVVHVYKVRRGKYTNLKQYVYFDHATCRLYDCFCVDAKNQYLPIAGTETEVERILDENSATAAEVAQALSDGAEAMFPREFQIKQQESK